MVTRQLSVERRTAKARWSKTTFYRCATEPTNQRIMGWLFELQSTAAAAAAGGGGGGDNDDDEDDDDTARSPVQSR